MSRVLVWARHKRLGPALFVTIVLVFLFAPIAIVVGFSLNDSPRLSIPFEGVSIRWYQRIFDDPLFSNALRRSLIAAIISALVATPLGTAFAFGIRRLRNKRTRALALMSALLPLIIPVLLLGIGLAIMYNEVGLRPRLAMAIPGHILIALPFVILSVNSALDNFPFEILRAASDLGASRVRAFWTITLPIIRPAVEGAFLLAMALSIDEFVISLFTAGNDTTLPLLIWAKMRRGIDPTINAIATLMLVGTVGLSLVAARRAAARSR